jgi:hypothetical protein
MSNSPLCRPPGDGGLNISKIAKDKPYSFFCLPMSLLGWQQGEANKRWDPINLFRPGIISSWSHFTVENRKNTSIYELGSDALSFGCQTTQDDQKALALPEKEVIQPHLPVRLPCYDFTPVTSPAFGIPLLAVKVTTWGMASSHSVTGGVYKARERIHRRMADRRLLAIPASCRRVAACNPN